MTTEHVRRLAESYSSAKSLVISSGFQDEVTWQASLSFDDFSETDFLRESAWVILCSGFREMIVRRMFGYISLCFCDWESAAEIVRNASSCRSSALSRLKHPGKIDAIVRIAKSIHELGFAICRRKLIEDPIAELQRMPFIGPATCYHLAKNLGLPVAKPDRHLVRIAKLLHFQSVQELCASLSAASGDSVPVVDVVLWRFATLVPEYLNVLATGRFGRRAKRAQTTQVRL